MIVFEDMLLTEPPIDLAAIKARSKELELYKQATLYAKWIGEEARSPAELLDEPVAKNALTWAQGRVELALSIVKQTRPLEQLTKGHLLAVAERCPIWKTAMERAKKSQS